MGGQAGSLSRFVAMWLMLIIFGLLALALLLWSAGRFAQARVANAKALFGWLSAMAGLAIGGGLLLTGRGASALLAAVLLTPLALTWWQEGRSRAARRLAGPRGPAVPHRASMTRAEALRVLGLPAVATASDVRAAWVRLMQSLHPDRGGSDWLAAQINQARDTLLRG